MPNNPASLPWCKVIIAALAIGSVDAHAESELSGINIGELGRVQSETILLNAQAEREKARRSVSGIDAAPASPQPNIVAGMDAAKPQAPSLPVITEILGSNSALRATLRYSSGIEIEAKAGRELPDGYRVASITLDGVTLERAGRRFPLGFQSRLNQFAPGAVVPGAVPGSPGPL